jgi:hypothetical protein
MNPKRFDQYDSGTATITYIILQGHPTTGDVTKITLQQLCDLFGLVPGLKDLDIGFDFNDVTTGVAQTYIIDPLVSWNYTVNSICLQSDSTMDNIAVKINSTDITSLEAIDVTTTMTETTATGANSAVVNDVIKIITSGTDGGATILRGKLRITRI